MPASPTSVTLQEALRLAIRHHQAGQLAEAEAIYRQILQQQPQHADALHLLGVIAHQVGQPAVAADLIMQALQAAPRSPEFHANLGEALRALGRLDEAIAAYRKAIRLNPQFASAYNNLGIALKEQGKPGEAVTAYRRALACKPDYPQALNNLAIALKEQGDTGGAVELYRRALELHPGNAETHNNLGAALNEQGRHEEAAGHFRRALELKPEFADAGEGMGSALMGMGRLDEAIAAVRDAVRLNPGLANAYNNLGVALKDDGQAGEAIEAYGQALALDPSLADAHNNLGIVLKEQGRLEEAIDHLEQAIALRPGYAEAYSNLGLVLEIQGRVEEALAAYRQALAYKPEMARAHSNMLFALNYPPGLAAEAVYQEHLRWGQAYGAAPQPLPARAPAADGRLRIGYVSPDFRRHPVAYFIESVLEHHDRKRFEIFCYSDVSAPDGATARLRTLSEHWRDIYGQSDEPLAEQIARDGIDILIDLAGHTDKNRLRLFARRAAPVQASWIGYFNTSGLPSMDYFISDVHGSPEDSPQYFSECLVRLPHSRFCYRPPAYAPAVAEPPVLRRGFVTFGCFNNLAKINAEVTALWAEILAAVPGSRLLLKSLALGDEGTAARYRTLFASHGIAPERLELSGFSSHAEMLAQYGEMDIALDPFPFTGGLTTCEALWMGVPLVTLAGRQLAGRQSASLLANLEKTEWIAQTPGQYRDTALELASDPDRLASLRKNLREQMAQSPLCDGAAFAQDLESAYEQMWRGTGKL